MKTIKITITLILFMLFISSCNMRKMLIKVMYNKGQVLKQYEQGTDYYMVIKEGQKIIKYRLYTYTVGMNKGATSEIIYGVDTITQTCYTGNTGQTPIECEKVKKDPDLLPYITW